jgi:hypothetical protein
MHIYLLIIITAVQRVLTGVVGRATAGLKRAATVNVPVSFNLKIENKNSRRKKTASGGC